MTLTIDLEGQGHTLLPMVDYLGKHVKFIFLKPIVCENHDLSAFAPSPRPLTLKVKVTFCSLWLIMWVHMSKTKAGTFLSWYIEPQIPKTKTSTKFYKIT